MCVQCPTWLQSASSSGCSRPWTWYTGCQWSLSLSLRFETPNKHPFEDWVGPDWLIHEFCSGIPVATMLSELNFSTLEDVLPHCTGPLRLPQRLQEMLVAVSHQQHEAPCH